MVPYTNHGQYKTQMYYPQPNRPIQNYNPYPANTTQFQNDPNHHHYALLAVVLIAAIIASYFVFKNYSGSRQSSISNAETSSEDLPPEFPGENAASTASNPGSSNIPNNNNELPPQLPN